MPEENKKPDQNLRTLHQALVADKFYQENIPQQYEEFVALYSQPENARNLHAALAADKFYEENVPKDFNEAMSLYGLGKPSAEPRGASGLAQKSVGSPMVTEAPVPTQPTQSSAPQYLSPEELGGVQQLPSEETLTSIRAEEEAIAPSELSAGLPAPTRTMQRAQTQERVRAIKEIEDDARAFLQKQDGEKVAKEEGAVMSAVRSFARGSDRLMQGLLNSPAFIYELAAWPQNTIAEQFNIPSLEVSSTEVFGESEAAKQLSERIERSQAVTQSKYDKGITEYISKGDYGNAAGLLFSQISESAPITLSLMAGNAAGLSTAGSTIGGGVVFGSDKKKELDKEAPWMSEAQKTQIAFANGLLEGFFEQYGITKLGSIAKDVLERSGKAAAEKAAEKYFKDTYGKVLLKYLGVTGEEAVSEMATQFSQNALDKYTGVKPDLDLMDGVIDAGLVGFASGSIYSAIPSGIELARTREAKKKNAKIQQEKQDLSAAAQQAEGNPVVQKAYAEKMKELNLQEAEALAEENAAYRNLSPENKDMVDALSVEVNDLETQLQDENLPEVAKSAIKDRIAQIDAKIDSIVFPAPAPEVAPEVEETVEVTEKQPEPTPVAEEVVEATKEQEVGEFSIQGTFDGLRQVLGSPENQIPDIQRGDIKRGFYEFNQNGKKIFTLRVPQPDNAGRGGYLAVSLVLPETTTKTIDDVKRDLEEKLIEAETAVNLSRERGFPLELTFRKISSEYREPSAIQPAKTPNVPEPQEQTPTENPALADVESTAKALEGVDAKVIMGKTKTFDIKGINNFFHASSQKRKGRLLKSNAPQFGTGVYFSTNKDLVKDEFGENITNVALNLSNPVYTNTKQWQDVIKKSIQLADLDYGKKRNLTLEEGETFFRYDPDLPSEIDEIPSKFISDAAQELGYDAIIDKNSSPYENEINVLDDSKIIYEEDIPIFISEAYHKAKADGSNPELVAAVEKLLGQKASPSVQVETKPQKLSDALKDVESTAKALNGVDVSSIEDAVVEKSTKQDRDYEDDSFNTYVEQYTESEYLNEAAKQSFGKLYSELDSKQKRVIDLQKKQYWQGDGFYGLDLDAFYGKTDKEARLSFFDIEQGNNKSISEAYHKAKQDDSNPELVRAVENLLTPQTDETQIETQAEAASTEAAVSQAERGGASQEEAVNQVPADTAVALKETPEVSVGDESGYTPDDFASAVSNIKSQNLTRIEGIGMGANQAMGTFISTEPENRYASSPLAQGKKVVSIDVDIKNPFVSYDTNFIDLRTRLLNENQSQFDELDFETFEMPEGESWTIDDLNENGIEKLSQMVTDRLKSLGYDSVYFPMTDSQEGELIVFDRKNVKPKKDAVQKQTAGEVPVQPKAGVGKKVEEGTPRPKPEETTEAKEAKVKRDFAQRVSAYNNSNKTYKRSEEGRNELDEIKKQAESLGYKTDVSASKSGLFKISVKDSKGKAITLSSSKRVESESNADWSNGSQFAVIGRDYQGNKIVRFFDSSTGVELNPRSKEYLSAKSEFISDNAKKFIGIKEPIDIESIANSNGFNVDGYYEDLRRALLESDNAFEILANKDVVSHFENSEGFGYVTQFEAELADWVGSVSEEEFNQYFDRNYVSTKRNPWVSSKGEKRSPLDDRVKALVDGEADGLLSVYMNADEGKVFEDISNLIQKYPGGRSTIGVQQDTRAKEIKDHFRELTTLPWNDENIALMNTLFDMISEGDIDSKFNWDSLTNEQKNTLINEQESAFRESEELYSEEFGVSEEVSDSETEVDQPTAKEIVEQIEVETPSAEEKSEIKDDGFEVPTKTEMEQKRDEIKAKFEDAVKELKESFGDLLSKNLGVSFDPKIEAAKQFRFHKALVNAARLAIQLGVTDVKIFAQSLGKPRVDKFMERAWQDAELAEAGRPTIINTEEDMLNATYQRVSEVFKKQYDDAEAARKPFLKKVKEGIMSGLFEPDYVARKMLKNVGAYQALIDKDLILGTSARAKSQYDSMRDEIFGGLNSAEKIQLNNVIQARVIISIDTRKDAAGEKRPKHPGDTTMEDQKIWLGQLEADNPKLYQKLDDRATKYFNAQKELLAERLREGRITIDQYDAMVNNEYSPRVFLKFLVEEQESGKSVSNGGVAQADIKSLSDGDVESLYHNAEWLLQTNVLSTNRAIFHNRANRALFDFAKQNPNNGLIQIQNPSGFSSQSGQPTYSDPKVGFKQIQFFENGVRKSMVVPTEFYTSWNSTEPYINPAFANTVRTLLGGSLKRMFATGINPAFALVNIPRDIAHVLFFTNTYSPFLPKALGQIGVDIAKVFPDALRKSLKNKNSRYYQYADEGGLMDLLTTQGRPFEKTGLESNKLIDGVNTAVKVAGYLNETSELMVRLAIRDREINKNVAKFLRDNGRSPSTSVPSGMNMSEMDRIKRNATQAARSYMDFSKGGRWAKAVDVFIPYFNAGVQGSYVAARYVRDNPAVFTAKMLQFAGLIAAATLYNLRYDEYDDIPEEEKVRNIILMLPTSKTNDEGKVVRDYITIPLQQTVSPYKTMIEAMTEWYSTGSKPKKAGLKALETAVPIPNPMNVPLIDAMNLYAKNYDSFLNKKVFKYGDKEAGDIEPYAEFYPYRTPEMFKDAALAAKEVGIDLSPERFKEALGKLTADPDNNIYYVALSKAYDTVFDKIPEDQKKPFAEQFRSDMLQILNPFERKFYRTTNPNLKQKTVKEIERQVLTKEKLQDDQVNKFVREYIKGEKSEFQVKSDFRDFIRTMEKSDTVNVERLKNKFENSIRFKEVDNVFYKMRTAKREETKAHLFYYEWISSSPEKRKILVEQGKMLGVIPKSQGTVFWTEFDRLKKNLGE